MIHIMIFTVYLNRDLSRWFKSLDLNQIHPDIMER